MAGEPLQTVCLGNGVTRRRPGCSKVRRLFSRRRRRDLRSIEYGIDLKWPATLSSSLAPEYPVEADAFCVKVRASARLFRVMYRVVKRPEVRRDRLFAELGADDVVEPATRVIQELAYMYTRHVPPVMHATIRKRARSRIINRVDRHNMPHQTTALVVRTTGTMAICDILGVGELQLP